MKIFNFLALCLIPFAASIPTSQPGVTTSPSITHNNSYGGENGNVKRSEGILYVYYCTGSNWGGKCMTVEATPGEGYVFVPEYSVRSFGPSQGVSCILKSKPKIVYQEINYPGSGDLDPTQMGGFSCISG